jgi:hypothetical protein
MDTGYSGHERIILMRYCKDLNINHSLHYVIIPGRKNMKSKKKIMIRKESSKLSNKNTNLGLFPEKLSIKTKYYMKMKKLSFILLLVVFLILPTLTAVSFSKSAYTSKKHTTIQTSSKDPIEFGEIFSECDDGRLEATINTTVNENGILSFINITFSAVSLLPPAPEANTFTMILYINDSLILNETYYATEHTNYSITRDINREVVEGHIVELNATCPDGSAQTLFLGFNDNTDTPSLKCILEYANESGGQVHGGVLLLLLSQPAESKKILGFPFLVLMVITFVSIVGLIRYYRRSRTS